MANTDRKIRLRRRRRLSFQARRGRSDVWCHTWQGVERTPGSDGRDPQQRRAATTGRERNGIQSRLTSKADEAHKAACVRRQKSAARARSAVHRLRRPPGQFLIYRILTARAASSASTVREISDCIIISTFAQRVSTGTSVGENAVLVLKARNK